MIRHLIACLMMLALISGCSKDNQNNNNSYLDTSQNNNNNNTNWGPIPDHSLMADINGTAKTWQPPTATMVSDSVMSISGTNQDNTSMTFYFPKDIGVGAFPLTAYGNYIGRYNNGSEIFTPINGTLNIVLHDTHTKIIKGHFHYTGVSTNHRDTVNVTNGQFSVNY